MLKIASVNHNIIKTTNVLSLNMKFFETSQDSEILWSFNGPQAVWVRSIVCCSWVGIDCTSLALFIKNILLTTCACLFYVFRYFEPFLTKMRPVGEFSRKNMPESFGNRSVAVSIDLQRRARLDFQSPHHPVCNHLQKLHCFLWQIIQCHYQLVFCRYWKVHRNYHIQWRHLSTLQSKSRPSLKILIPKYFSLIGWKFSPGSIFEDMVIRLTAEWITLSNWDPTISFSNK